LNFLQAKFLEQMDEEYSDSHSSHKGSEQQKQKVMINTLIQFHFLVCFQRYISKDLTGLRVEHSAEEFKEGQAVILTLKDRSMSNKFF
jgi:hypothetical protein